MKPFDENGEFLSATDNGGLRRLALRGAGVTILAQGVGFAVQIISIAVLARLLTPSDFGLVAMVTIFSLLLASFGQIGLQEAIVQREKIDHFLASNLFWINIGAGLFLMIGFAAAGSLLARFYGDPLVEGVAVGLSLSIFITSTSVLHLALLKRAMRFSAVSATDILGRTLSVAISVFLAWAGWGYWALVAGTVAQPLATSIGAWTLCRWVPSLPRHVAAMGSMVRFALNVNTSWNIDYFARNLDNILLGWQFGPGPLGFYKKAYDLFALPSNQLLSVFPVAVSALSRLQGDPVQYRRNLLGTISILAFLGMGVGASLTLVIKDLVYVILGSGWEESGEIFMFFGPGIGIMIVYRTFGMIHLSIGTADRFLRWRLVEITVIAVLFFMGLPWGAMGIAAAWTVSYWILVIPTFWYAGKPIQLGITPIAAAVWRFCLASLLAGCVCEVIVRGIPSLVAMSGYAGAITRIVTTSLLFGILYLCVIIILHGGVAPLRQFTGLLQELVPWGKARHSNDESPNVRPISMGKIA